MFSALIIYDFIQALAACLGRLLQQEQSHRADTDNVLDAVDTPHHTFVFVLRQISIHSLRILICVIKKIVASNTKLSFLSSI